MQKTYFSRRIRKSQLEENCLQENDHDFIRFNQAKHFAFQTFVREKRWKKKLHKTSIHLVVKQRFGFNDYYANSVVREAKALFSSQQELQKLYAKQEEVKIVKLKKKLQQERKIYTQMKAIKESLIQGSLQFPKNLQFAKHKSGLVSLTRKRETLIWWNTYLFEHQYVDVRLKHVQAKIGHLEHRLFRLQQKRDKRHTHLKCRVRRKNSIQISIHETRCLLVSQRMEAAVCTKTE